jgi:hypothetical protein
MNGPRLRLSAFFAAGLLVAACGSANVSRPSVPAYPAGTGVPTTAAASLTAAPTDAPCAQNDIHELILGQTVRAA